LLLDHDEGLLGDVGVGLQLSGDVAGVLVVRVPVVADLGDDYCYGVLRGLLVKIF